MVNFRFRSDSVTVPFPNPPNPVFESALSGIRIRIRSASESENKYGIGYGIEIIRPNPIRFHPYTYLTHVYLGLSTFIFLKRRISPDADYLISGLNAP